VGTVALQRQGEDRARVGDKDPSRGRTGRTRPRFGADRFPDLQRKSVWLEKLDLATSADILIKRPDDSVDLVTFG